MDEVIEYVAHELSQKYGENEVERNALYAIILPKLYKEYPKWRKLSSLRTFLKTVAYNAVLDYKSSQKSWDNSNFIFPIIEAAYEDEDYKKVENKMQSELLLNELRDNTTYYEYKVICMTFGLDEYEMVSRKEILDQILISESEQRTIIKNVMDRLRENKIVKELYKSL